MKKITAVLLGALAVFSPIELSIIVLMFMIFIDTLVKMISLKKLANAEERKFFEVFSSKMLRHGYIYKSAGYFILALALFPLDYFFLTPFFWDGQEAPAIFRYRLKQSGLFANDNFKIGMGRSLPP